jgi:hypothetical protein
VTPATQRWQAPPAPLGRGGYRPGGVTAAGQTSTELGDAVEAALVAQLGFERALAPGVRQGPIDVFAGDYAFEVKAVTRQACEYKAKPKKREVAQKLAAAAQMGKVPAMVMVVVDGARGWAYWREGIGAFRLTDRWQFAGQLVLSDGSLS